MAYTTFDVNIFGTQNRNLDGSNANGFLREFTLHVLQVECNQIISNFDMFIEFYAYPWGDGSTGPVSPSYLLTPNNGTMVNKFLNNKPQVIHIDSMTPISPVNLYPSCSISPAAPCPNPVDMRLFSMFFEAPIEPTLTGYDTDETNMYNDGLLIAKLPVNITIIADGCKYNSEVNTEINIYRDYNTATALFGSSDLINNPDQHPIGFNEKITIA